MGTKKFSRILLKFCQLIVQWYGLRVCYRQVVYVHLFFHSGTMKMGSCANLPRITCKISSAQIFTCKTFTPLVGTKKFSRILLKFCQLIVLWYGLRVRYRQVVYVNRASCQKPILGLLWKNPASEANKNDA